MTETDLLVGNAIRNYLPLINSDVQGDFLATANPVLNSFTSRHADFLGIEIHHTEEESSKFDLLFRNSKHYSMCSPNHVKKSIKTDYELLLSNARSQLPDFDDVIHSIWTEHDIHSDGSGIFDTSLWFEFKPLVANFADRVLENGPPSPKSLFFNGLSHPKLGPELKQWGLSCFALGFMFERNPQALAIACVPDHSFTESGCERLTDALGIHSSPVLDFIKHSPPDAIDLARNDDGYANKIGLEYWFYGDPGKLKSTIDAVQKLTSETVIQKLRRVSPYESGLGSFKGAPAVFFYGIAQIKVVFSRSEPPKIKSYSICGGLPLAMGSNLEKSVNGT